MHVTIREHVTAGLLMLNTDPSWIVSLSLQDAFRN